ncbi:MAG: hypothetical protein IKM62_05030 [Kiritimatiellae bacterium]|nr:hypothetical protein [Kiritimatiellia bacterium]
MKSISLIRSVILGSLVLSAFTGCQTIRKTLIQEATPAAPSATAEAAAEQPPVDKSRCELKKWLADAPVPAQVQCSVSSREVPEAVARFNQLAVHSAQLYTLVYEDAHSAMDAVNAGDLSKDPVLAKVAGMLNSPEKDWKTVAQTQVVDQYQQIRMSLEGLNKEAMAFTDTLKTDATLATLQNTAERTRLLISFGNDSMRLMKQVQQSMEGAMVVRKRRMATILGKK